MRKAKTKRIKFLKGEKIMYVLLMFLVLAIPICNVFTQAKLSESNIAVSRLNSKIEAQEKVNESLNMQINELASLENIKALADDLGLSYNNNNIKNINE